MKILAVSGSASARSGNYYLLKAIQLLFKKQHEFTIIDSLHEFPLFSPQALKEGVPSLIKEFKELVVSADAVILSTPEYTHNIPAVLKNMLEWCTHSGEFENKPVLPITFTPHEPRGEYAMKSLLFSLTAMDAKIVAQLPLYKTDVEIKNQLIELPTEMKEILSGAIDLL